MPRMKHYTRYPIEYFQLTDAVANNKPLKITAPSESRARSIRTELYNLRISLRKAAKEEEDFNYHDVLNAFESMTFQIVPTKDDTTYVYVSPKGYPEILKAESV